MKWIRKHYHWVVAVALFVITVFRGGIANNLSPLHLLPVTEALDISRTQYSMAGSASYITTMLMVLISGVLILRFGYRLLLATFLLVGAVAFTVMGKTDTYLIFFAGYAVWGLVNGICGEATITRIVSVWFHKHKGAVLGIVSSATGLGGSLICILQTAAMERGTYRSSYFLAAVLLVIGSLLALAFIRSHPAKMGLLPYGDGEKLQHKKREHDEDHWQGLTMGQMVHRPTFYMLIIGTLLTCTCSYMALSVLIPHFQDKGLSATDASGLQSIMMLVLIGTKIFTGYLCDAIGSRKTTLLCMGFMVAALVLIAKTTTFGLGLIAVIVYAMALPLTTITIPMLALSLFGYQDQAKHTGIFISMCSAAGILGSPISNAIFDRVGSYSPAMMAAAGITAVLIGVYLWMYRLAKKDRIKPEITEPQS